MASSGVSADKAKGLLRRPWRNLCSIKLNQYLQPICYYHDMVLRLTRFYSKLRGLYYTASLLKGGMEFLLALHLTRGSVSRVAGLIYGTDLVGGWFGALMSSTLLIPILGIPQTCLALAGLALLLAWKGLRLPNPFSCNIISVGQLRACRRGRGL